MSLNSSIFSFRIAPRLIYFALTVATSLLALATLSFFSLNNGLTNWKSVQLYHYQLDKLARADKIDILLLGDSTLGHGIDARQWTKKYNLKTLSLALTGSYGYAGSLNMLRRMLRKTKPRYVVFFQAPDTMTRKVAHQGLLYTAERLSDLSGLPWSTLFTGLVNLDLPWQAVKSLIFGRPKAPTDIARNDYPTQKQSLSINRPTPEMARPLKSADINPDKIYYLVQYAKTCREFSLKCFYLHGPLAEPACRNSKAYITDINRIITRAGITVAPGTPICLPWAVVGDSTDHVAPNYRGQSSHFYFQLLRPCLVGECPKKLISR